jgi:hypothetical protein
MARDPNAVDNPVAATSRFLMEIAAWVAAPWALWDTSRVLAIVVLLVLLWLPGVYSVPGDKNFSGRPVSGPVRIAIELLLMAAAVWGAWSAWPDWAAITVSVVTGIALLTNLPRWRWLAPRPGSYERASAS